LAEGGAVVAVLKKLKGLDFYSSVLTPALSPSGEGLSFQLGALEDNCGISGLEVSLLSFHVRGFPGGDHLLVQETLSSKRNILRYCYVSPV
jgi:hypothetical protein